MANTSADYRIKLAAVIDTKSLNEQLKHLSQTSNLKELKIKISISENSLTKVKELNELLSRTDALNDYTKSLKNIQETMKSYENIASKTAKAAQSMYNSIHETGETSKKTDKQMRSLGQTSADVFQKFNQWSIIRNVWVTLYNDLKQLVNTVLELDRAFVELSKVTDLTNDDFNRITKQAYELGSEVAKTTTEVIDAMTEFAKAGYSVEESTNILAKNALMWTNIADGTVDASEAANMIISVMKAFNMQAGETTHIINALNEVKIRAFLYSNI